jgi:hypothetical protein
VPEHFESIASAYREARSDAEPETALADRALVSMIPKKPAPGLDHRKSDVSDLRPFKRARTRQHPSSGGGYRFSEKIMLH